MLKITRHNVNDRIVVRDRNRLSGLGRDLLTGMSQPREVLRPLTAAFMSGAQTPRHGNGIKRHAFCPAPRSSSPLPPTRQRATEAATVVGFCSAV